MNKQNLDIHPKFTMLNLVFHHIKDRQPERCGECFPSNLQDLLEPVFPGGRTILHHIVMTGDPVCLYIFFNMASNGENCQPVDEFRAKLINRGDLFGITPFMMAAHNAWHEGVRFLKKIGGDILQCDTKFKFNTIHWLISAKSTIHIIQELVHEKAYVERTQNDVLGYTLAELAIIQGKIVMLKHFLGVGCILGDNALHLAIQGKQTKIVEFLISRCNVNAKNKDGLTCLQLAVITGGQEGRKFVDLLLNAKADINTVTQNGFSALMYATMNACQDKMANDSNTFDIISTLLAKGANVTYQDATTGCTALMMSLCAQSAIFKLHVKFVTKQLLDLKNKQGKTCYDLMFAMQREDINLLKHTQ